MTCRGKLDLARRHAELVEQISGCAPAVSAPYLTAAIERCKLPIKVAATPLRIADRIIDRTRFGFVVGRIGDPKTITYTGDADEAVRAYLRLVETLTRSAAPISPSVPSVALGGSSPGPLSAPLSDPGASPPPPGNAAACADAPRAS